MQDSEDLNTYVNYICSRELLTPKYKGIKIIVCDSAMRELVKENKTIYEVIEILEKGYDAPRKRKKNTIEKWLDKKNKTFNAVIVHDYNEIMKEDCWVLIHFGKFTRK